MPVVISSRSFGSESNSSAGNGVRSRMITTISLSAIASTRSAPDQVLGHGAYADAGQRVPVGERSGHALVVVEDGAGQHELMLPEPAQVRPAPGCSGAPAGRDCRSAG